MYWHFNSCHVATVILYTTILEMDTDITRVKVTMWLQSSIKHWFQLERVCSQTQLCQLRCLMTILDNYMFRPLLAIFRLSLRELKFLLYNVCARDGETSTSGLRNS